MTDQLRTSPTEPGTTATRASLGTLTLEGRDPLVVLAAQEQNRIAELLPLRHERMAASPFAFYRGAAAVMAADLAASPSSGISVAACGDAHLANFGLYASPERKVVFDLNDFDEAAWAPWEWDLKRLITSFVVSGRVSKRPVDAITAAAEMGIQAYLSALATAMKQTPLERYYVNADVDVLAGYLKGKTLRHLQTAVTAARGRTTEQAAAKMTSTAPDGTLRFVDRPPVLTHLTQAQLLALGDVYGQYLASASPDIALLVDHYTLADTARRVVGVGSVGTECLVAALRDQGGSVLILQAKQAVESVLVTYGKAVQPANLNGLTVSQGHGARVVSLQRILQACSDPFLGHFSGPSGDFYVRQFRDMKGGVDPESLGNKQFAVYARLCATMLARSHAQSPTATAIGAFAGGGKRITRALVDFCEAYADINARDHKAFKASLKG